VGGRRRASNALGRLSASEMYEALRRFSVASSSLDDRLSIG
jgi:hypothetical protein